MPRTLITGATGFIGCRLAELWYSQGRAVQAVGRVRNAVEEKRAAGLRQAGVPLLIGDLASDQFIVQALDGADTVIHLAAAQHEANVDEDYFVTINVDATRRLLKSSEEHGIARFFYASSIGVYGVNDDPAIDEGTVLAPDNPYGRSKVAAEAMLADHQGSTQIFIGRIGETYGPWDFRLHKLFVGIRDRHFWLVGPGMNLHQPIYVDDLASAIDRLIASPGAARIPVILCGDRAVTTRQMCENIAASVEAKLSRWSIPMWPLLISALGMELTLGRLGIQPPLHGRRLDFFRKSLSFSTSLRDRLLALPPQLTFREGADKTATWYRAHDWL
ncbi:MAG: NAD(P)-dependent oxidoreductase [Woeseia sp.]